MNYKKKISTWKNPENFNAARPENHLTLVGRYPILN